MPDSPDEFYDLTKQVPVMEPGTQANGLLVDVSRVQGTVTTTGPGSGTGNPAIVRLEDGTTTQLATVTGAGAVKVDGSAATQPVSGAKTPADGQSNPTDAVDVESFGMAFNGTTWDRVRSGSPTADPGNIGVVAAQIHGTDGTNIRRVTAFATTADGISTADIGVHAIDKGYAFNGSTWDRTRTELPAGSETGNVGVLAVGLHTTDGTNLTRVRNPNGVGDGTTGVALVGEGGYLFNGSTWDRVRSGAQTGSVFTSTTPGSGTTQDTSATAAVNTATSTSIPAVAAKTSFIQGFTVTTQGGAAAAAGVVTITGLANTLSFQVGAAANNLVTFSFDFPHPIPASAVNTAIVVNVPALGASTGAVAVTAHGFQL